ncbi:MAG: flagellar basal body-associated protein FliL [Psychromonas sp.]|nr:flagellar basal body-associated protein FliL [Psychromonas sp.]
MADEDNADVSLDEEGATQGGGKKKLIIIIVAVVVLLGAAAGAYFFMIGGGDSAATSEQTSEQAEEGGEQGTDSDLSAIYVAMPRPFVFNVMDGKRDRLVQIKVQLMVRGTNNETLAKKHIPLLEGTLVRVFGAATVAQLRSPDGKDQMREHALEALNESTKKLEGKALIHTVLFTGFVLQ